MKLGPTSEMRPADGVRRRMREDMVRCSNVLKAAVGSAAILMAVLVMTAPGAGAAACRIAILGDSLTSAYGLPVEEGFPATLERELGARDVDCEVQDAGVSGDTSAGGLARIDWVLADAPTHLLIELGGNDGLRGLPVDQMRKNLARIIERATAEGAHVLLTGMEAPPNFGATYTSAFRRVFPELAKTYDVPLYPFFLEGVAADPALNQSDGIHPNAKGVEKIVEGILPTVLAWLESTQPSDERA